MSRRRDEQVARERAAYDGGIITAPVKELERYKAHMSVILEDGTGFGWPDGAEPPKVGAVVTVYGTFGGNFVGVDVDGALAFWKTEEDRVVADALFSARRQLEKIEAFATHREAMDEALDALPPLFALRIAKFHDTAGPSWRWEHEAYEMAATGFGARLAAWLRDRVGGEHLDLVDIGAFMGDAVRHVGGEGSANTDDLARVLALHALKDPARVVLEHGAMTPLTGCKAYGCPHPIPADLMRRVDELVPGTVERYAQEVAS